jgi:Concanavalin A-like lectin/glucanases superfamily
MNLKCPLLRALLACLPLVPFAPSASAAAPTTGLVAKYLFNTGSPNADSSGHSPAASSKNGVTRTTNRFGVASSAWGYDGVDSYAEIADSSNFSINTTGYLTVCVWVKPVGTSLNASGELLFSHTQGSGYVYYLGKGTMSGASGNQEWAYRIYSADNTEARHNRMSYYIWSFDGGLGPGCAVQDTLTNGAWIHFVAVVSKPEHMICYYKNGVLRGSTSFGPGSSFPIADGDLRNGNAPLRIGTRDLNSFLKGSIDNLYIYNRKLTAAEVTQVYNDTTN